MTKLAVTVPEGFEIVEARSSGPWTGDVSGDTATWSGGRVAAKAAQSFSLDVKARSQAGVVELKAVQTYPDGGIVQWPVSLTVVPGTESSQHFGRALVAAIFGLLAITAVVVLLRQRRVRSLQEK